jgi:hypothetical protein
MKLLLLLTLVATVGAMRVQRHHARALSHPVPKVSAAEFALSFTQLTSMLETAQKTGGPLDEVVDLAEDLKTKIQKEQEDAVQAQENLPACTANSGTQVQVDSLTPQLQQAQATVADKASAVAALPDTTQMETQANNMANTMIPAKRAEIAAQEAARGQAKLDAEAQIADNSDALAALRELRLHLQRADLHDRSTNTDGLSLVASAGSRGAKRHSLVAMVKQELKKGTELDAIFTLLDQMRDALMSDATALRQQEVLAQEVWQNTLMTLTQELADMSKNEAQMRLNVANNNLDRCTLEHAKAEAGKAVAELQAELDRLTLELSGSADLCEQSRAAFEESSARRQHELETLDEFIAKVEAFRQGISSTSAEQAISNVSVGYTRCSAGYASEDGWSGNAPCTLCPPGTFAADEQNPKCYDCPEGRYAASAGTGDKCTDQITECGPGTELAVGSATTPSVCAACAPGKFSADTSPQGCQDKRTECMAAGHHLVAKDATSDDVCENCPEGRFKPDVGSGECTPHTVTSCPAGSGFVPGNHEQDGSCSECGSGRFSSGAHECTDFTDRTCPPGQGWHAGTATSDTRCEACPAGTFSSTTDQSACTEWTANCHSGEAMTGGTASQDVVCLGCDAGFFFDTQTSTCKTCSSCPDGRVATPCGTYHDTQCYGACQEPVEANAHWATRTVGFSSVYNDGDANCWCRNDALGPPNTCSFGDIITAFAFKTSSMGFQWIEVEMANYIAVTGVTVRETCGTGFIHVVEISRDGDSVQTLWNGPMPASTEVRNSYFPYHGADNTGRNRVKVTVDTDRGAGWDEIDAIALHGTVVS